MSSRLFLHYALANVLDVLDAVDGLGQLRHRHRKRHDGVKHRDLNGGVLEDVDGHRGKVAKSVCCSAVMLV